MINNSTMYEHPYANRVVVIGDIHGDIKRFKNILIHAKIINNDLEWIADPPNTIVVQMGDQIDSANRHPDSTDWEKLEDISMLYFTNSIDVIAKGKGGRVISMIGNHELMNVMGNFAYVSKNSQCTNRHQMFMPTGTLSSILANRPIVLKIGSFFFCHAGIKRKHLDILEKHNKEISYLNKIWKQFLTTNNVYIQDKEIFEEIIVNDNGILWTRELDNKDDMEYVLKHLGCRFIFVGHSTVDSIQLINDSIWLTDNGISRAFGGTSYQYMNIINNSIHIETLSDIN